MVTSLAPTAGAAQNVTAEVAATVPASLDLQSALRLLYPQGEFVGQASVIVPLLATYGKGMDTLAVMSLFPGKTRYIMTSGCTRLARHSTITLRRSPSTNMRLTFMMARHMSSVGKHASETLTSGWAKHKALRPAPLRL
jgi:hypothetical protein